MKQALRITSSSTYRWLTETSTAIFHWLSQGSHLCADAPACMTGMSHNVTVDLQPGRLALQLMLQGYPCVGFTGKVAMTQMPALLLPANLSFAHLSLQARLRTVIQRSLPYGSAFMRLNQCMLPSSEGCHSSLPACNTMFASVEIPETQLTHPTPAAFNRRIFGSVNTCVILALKSAYGLNK